MLHIVRELTKQNTYKFLSLSAKGKESNELTNNKTVGTVLSVQKILPSSGHAGGLRLGGIYTLVNALLHNYNRTIPFRLIVQKK